MATTPIVKIVQSSDGTSIYAEAVGNAQKPCIIFVHGLNLSAAAFDSLFKESRLLDIFYLESPVRYDMRGHGRSGMPSNPESYISSLFADDYAAIIRAFNIKNVVHVGWSYGCTVAADVCAHLEPNPIVGIIYMAALPYVGTIMQRVGTPTVLGFLPGLMNTTDVALNGRTKVAFIDSLFTYPDKADCNVKTSWIGQATLQPPDVANSILTREQDPTKLFEAGRDGLPMLILNGTADKQVFGDVVVQEMSPYFKDLEVHMVENGAMHSIMSFMMRSSMP
ncbi:alpha/beta-hydrolase [Laetiporus sulphureus 93-53]|uniref:Alpha/beta-hydrolase n=1 Tax=Laetiporus sulphureus 93-53 TaxID=1314785 RepID=A0A165CNH9_9APHY|nr:alpha/beta-hydrolase [Laetiporus sulphureus 93-53]KZT03132.1 alpha/beta-hydrolase [Laetiporus sulphureus 93-53]